MKKDTKYKIASICFVLGVLTLLFPFPLRKEVTELPETGIELELEVELIVDKNDVQRDDPTDGAQSINYQVRVRNNTPCETVPVNIMLTFDKSGSMSDLIADARQAGVTFVQSLDLSKDLAGIATYDDTAHLPLGLSNSEAALVSTINSITAYGMTNIGDGISIAANELVSASNFSEASSVLIIFTDGRANRPRGVDAREYTITKANEAKDAGIRVISIAYGNYADQDLMMQVASSASDYYFAPTGSDMIAIYAAISESLQGHSPDTQVRVDLSQVANIVDVGDISAGGYYSSGQLIWDLNTLECQVTSIQDFTLRVNKNAQDLDIIDLIAIASNSAGSLVESTNAVTTVHAPAFNLSKTDNKDEAMPGETLNYEITVENVGTGNAYGVIITDTLPSEHFYVMPRSISDDGEYNSSTGEIVWDNDGAGYVLDGSFEPSGSEWGSSKTFTFSGDIDTNLDPGLYTLLDTVVLETPNGYTQQAQDETIILYSPDLSITKESDPPAYTYPGGEVDYTLTIRNNGNIGATGVVVIDDYDQTIISVDPEGGYVEDGTIVWLLGDLGVDEERTLTYRARVNDVIGENTVPIPNEAVVGLNEPDIDESDNIAVHEIIATQDPVLSILLTSDKLTYTMDEQIEYTIVITNDSDADAYNLDIGSVLPFELDYVIGSTMLDGVGYDDPDGTHDLSWSVIHLPSGESITLTFNAIPNENCDEDNYLATASIIWEDEEGNVFGPQSANCLVTIIDQQEGPIGDTEEGEPLVELTDEGLEGMIQMAQSAVLSNLARAGALVYLKVLLGVVLALPLPLMLIFGDRNDEEGEKKVSVEKKKEKKTAQKVKPKKKSRKK